jgi:hypothetical protein
MLFNHRTVYASLFFILIVLLVIVAKPKFAFDEHGNIKAFGIGPEKSVISLGVVVCVLAMWSFYIFTWIDIVFTEKIVYKL